MQTEAMVRELKRALNELDDCQRKIKSGNLDRARYDLSDAVDRIQSVIKSLKLR